VGGEGKGGHLSFCAGGFGRAPGTCGGGRLEGEGGGYERVTGGGVVVGGLGGVGGGGVLVLLGLFVFLFCGRVGGGKGYFSGGGERGGFLSFFCGTVLGDGVLRLWWAGGGGGGGGAGAGEGARGNAYWRGGAGYRGAQVVWGGGEGG